jgi:uncharacterized protein (DUF983 family)
VSFDVYFQGFVDGEPAAGGGELMRAVLKPFVTREEPEHDFLAIQAGDGTADVYLHSNGMMASHISGEDLWDLFMQGARAAGWVMMPVGCPVCLTDEGQRSDLPEGLQDEVVLVRSGMELLETIRSS